MSQIESAILAALSQEGIAHVSSEAIAEKVGCTHQEVVGAAKSLESEGYITAELQTVQAWKLFPEGKGILAKGSPEYLLWDMLQAGGMSQADAQTKLGGKEVYSVALTNGMKRKLFSVDKKSADVTVLRNPATSQATDEVRALLEKISTVGSHVDPKEVEVLKKRKLAVLESVKVFLYAKGPHYALQRGSKAATDLTKDMIQDGSWQSTAFKKYNFAASGIEVCGGQLHPLLKVRQEFREIFMEMGFQEMHTQQWVSSSFWNFDSLFIPQSHPARDLQDTFFVSKPEFTPLTPEAVDPKVLENVRKEHTTFFGKWCEEEATRNVLRTHTTGFSTYTLHKLYEETHKTGVFRPGRYYSIDRVFRNEEMDRTHLCEFHQVEGFVIDKDISLAKMMHTFNNFFRRIGIEQLRFKPTFNPYTEPSMEIFGYHKGLKKWVEVGNSGLFRQEVVGPLGFSTDISVMAWGLSLERPTMIKYGFNSIHDLFGHRVDVKFIKRAPLARF